MKRLISLCMIAVLMLSFAGCGKEEKEDKVQTDLKQYVETMLPSIKDEETAAITRYNEVCAGVADMKRDEIIDAFNNEIIPAHTTFCNHLQNISVATTEVQALKDTYVEGANLQLQGMTALVTAIQNNDSEAAKAANEQITQGKDKIDEHRKNIISLAAEHNITIQETTQGEDKEVTEETATTQAQ